MLVKGKDTRPIIVRSSRPPYQWDKELQDVAKKVAEALEENEKEDAANRDKK